MYNELPENLRRQVHNCLCAGDFLGAKDIHDAYFSQQTIQHMKATEATKKHAA